MQRAALKKAGQSTCPSTPPPTLPASQSGTHTPLAAGAPNTGMPSTQGEVFLTPVPSMPSTPQLVPAPSTPQLPASPATPQPFAVPGLSSPWTPLVIEPQLEMSLQLLLTPEAVNRSGRTTLPCSSLAHTHLPILALYTIHSHFLTCQRGTCPQGTHAQRAGFLV